MTGGILYNIMEKELDELIARAASWQDKLEDQGSVNSQNNDNGDDEWLRLCQEICDKADDYDNRRVDYEDEDDDEDALLFADYDIDVEDMEGDDEDDDYADDDDGGDDDGWLD